MSCKKCLVNLPEERDYVTCRKCSSDFHYNCSGLQKTSWEKKSAKKKAEWECEYCSKPPRTRFGSKKDDEGELTEDPVYASLKGFIEKMFEKQEKLITERVDRITAFMSTLEDKLTEMYDKIQKLEEDRDSFREELDNLKVILECERQYGRSKNMIITIIPYSDNEDVSAVIIKLLGAMDITLKREEFTAHRLPAKKGPPPIIVQCCTRDDTIRRKSGRLRFSRLEHEPRIYAAAPSGVLVARIRAFDVDDPNISPFYRLLGDAVPSGDAQYFQIHAESGNLTTKRYIDRPDGSLYNVMIVAYSNGETEYIDIAIRVTEYNKFPPLFRSQNYKADVELIAQVGTEIIRVHAEDKDPQPYNSEVYYYAQSRLVSINRTSGLISLRENLHPRDRTLTVSLLAFDGGSPRRSARSKLTINVKIISAPRNVRVEQTGDQWAMLCWSPPSSGIPQGYIIYMTSTTDFMTVSTQRNISKEEVGMRAGMNCTALTDLESWSDFDARIAGWDRSEVGMMSKSISFDTKVNNCPENACDQGECIVVRDSTVMYRCKCDPGYFGLRCDMYDPCYFEPCAHSGTCYNLNNSQFKCSCMAGFYGEDCSKFNPCSSTVNPCHNGGTCSSVESNQYECKCPVGYQGKSCEVFNACAVQGCKNGGVCENKSSTEYACACPLGYSGSMCEEDVDDCASSPCLNDGRCVDEVNSFRCICTPGFDGEVCEENVDECESSPCVNGGSCEDMNDGFLCHCPQHFTGGKCELKENICLSNACRNNATCVAATEASSPYTCSCRPGFTGKLCEVEVNECNSWPCLNGGSCVDGVNDFRCVCLAGYTGRRCDLHLDLCDKSPCKNGGSCVEHNEQFFCKCLPGYNGTYCQVKERCIAEVLTTKKGTFTWPELDLNQSVQLECPYGESSVESSATEKQKTLKKSINKENSETGDKVYKLTRAGRAYAERACHLINGSAVWSPVQDSNCKEQAFSMAEQMTQRLENLTRSPSQINASIVLEAASQLKQILPYALSDQKIAKSMIQVISSILEVNDSVLSQADGDGKSSQTFLDSINTYTRLAQVPTKSSILTLTSPNLVLDIRVLDKPASSSSSGVRFEPLQVYDSSAKRSSGITGTHYQVSIQVPQEALQEVAKPGSAGVRVEFVYFSSGKLFRGRNSGKPVAWHIPVISATLTNTSVSGLKTPVLYSLPSTHATSPVCVYWDHINSKWLSNGLRTNYSNGWVICQATHLTAFSVLLDPRTQRSVSADHEAVLTAISYFGALLSITGLMLTVLTYSIFRCLNRDRSGKILLNLCVSLLLMNVSFLLVSLKEHVSLLIYGLDTCTAVALLTHYLVLSSLSWMLVEAVNMYQVLITVFATAETRFMLKRMLFAWGAPLCVVGGTVYYTGVDYYRFQDPECLFSPTSPVIYYLTYVAPASIILLINTVVFFMVTRMLCQRRAITKNGHKNDEGVTAAQVRGAFTVMTLLGVTWIFGIFAVEELRLVFQYIFSVANSLQGFIIFIVRCVQYPEARRAWGRFLRTGELKSHRGGTARGASTRHTSSTSQTRGTVSIKGEMTWGGLRARNNQERMRELRTEIVRSRDNNIARYAASFTLPRPSPTPQQPVHPTSSSVARISRSRSLHLSKEGEDTSWRFMGPSTPVAPTDQGYGTAEHSPESPRQQPKRQQPTLHFSTSTPERLHTSTSPERPGPSVLSDSNIARSFLDEPCATRRDSDATTTGPASHSSTDTITSTTPSPSTTPTYSPSPTSYDVHVWSQTPLPGESAHKPPKRVPCEELL